MKLFQFLIALTLSSFWMGGYLFAQQNNDSKGGSKTKNAHHLTQTSQIQTPIIDNNDMAHLRHNPYPSFTTETASLITKMWNAYTTQASFTNQIAFDPSANLLGVIHRIDRTGAGSGRMVYRYSTNFGAAWSPMIGPVNEPFGHTLGRHPNIILSNPTHSTNINDVSVVMGIAELEASWRWLELIRDAYPASNNYTVKIDSFFFPGDEMTVDNSGNIFSIWNVESSWGGDSTVLNVLYRSTDKGISWSAAGIDNINSYDIGSLNGTKIEFGKGNIGYIVTQAISPFNTKYDFAYKKSTNSGATWSSTFTWLNWWNVPFGSSVLGNYVHALNYEVDFIVLDTDMPFFAGTFVDTDDGSETGVYAIYNLGAGWQAQLIKKVNKTSFALPGNLATLNEVELARDELGRWLMLKLIDVPQPLDTAQDVYVRWFGNGVWSPLINVTNTPSIKEKFSQLAARMEYDAVNSNLKAFAMYTIFGNNDQDDLAEAELWLINGIEINPQLIPVELTSFTGQFVDNLVRLDWTTASEKNNFGFDVERKNSTNDDWLKIGFVNGNGTTTTPHSYKFEDSQLPSDEKIFYRLKQLDLDGTFQYSSEVEIDRLPMEFSLGQNFPNPFNPTTTIKYQIAEPGIVSLKIYDILGNEVIKLVDEYQEAGNYSINFDASKISSGVYFYRLRANEFIQMRKMTLLR